jgi:cobalt/nickel transport system permease protein
MLTGSVCPVTGLIAIGGLALTSVLAVRQKEKPAASKFGAVAALIFGLQMLNFPISGSTSGHLVGGTLAAGLLGTPFGILALYLVVTVQALIFGDGGIYALGANILTMGLVGAGTGGYLRTLFSRFSGLSSSSGYNILHDFPAAFISVTAAAFACSAVLAAGSEKTFTSVINAMMGIHAVIGIGEGIITICAIRLTKMVKSDYWMLGIAAAAATASPMASGLPDGLEHAAHVLGLPSGEQIFRAFFMDYEAPYISGDLSSIAAGIAGVLMCYAAGRTVMLMQKYNSGSQTRHIS